MVGVVNTLVDFSVSSLCHYAAGLPEEIATPLGYVCGIICSYVLNGRFTFRAKGSVWKFILVNGVSLLISVGITHVLTVVGVEYVIAKALTIIVTTVINYAGYKLLVFKRK
jgi:putative flippase GtrA